MSTTDNRTGDRAQLLSIHLDDHLAGATAGSQRATRLAEGEAASEDGAALAELALDVDADLAALTTVMEALGVEPSRLKAGFASVAEKLGALKLNGRILERSPLTTIVAIEAMQMAVRGKRSLWETLLMAAPHQTGIDLHALISRAGAQLELLSGLHAGRVIGTFGARTS